jgi:hypothetical protein
LKAPEPVAASDDLLDDVDVTPVIVAAPAPAPKQLTAAEEFRKLFAAGDDEPSDSDDDPPTPAPAPAAKESSPAADVRKIILASAPRGDIFDTLWGRRSGSISSGAACGSFRAAGAWSARLLATGVYVPSWHDVSTAVRHATPTASVRLPGSVSWCPWYVPRWADATVWAPDDARRILTRSRKAA